MSDLLTRVVDALGWISLNRIDKHNAFDDRLLAEMLQAIRRFDDDPAIRVIILKAEGKHFSAGADLAWMQRMAQYSEAENQQDALVLAEVMAALYHARKPVIAMVHGSAFGGGVGLAAAVDLCIAASNAKFCFSEVKLGLIPAVISPYVIEAIGPRAARALFLTAAVFDAEEALRLGLVHQVVEPEELEGAVIRSAKTLSQYPAGALTACKELVQSVKYQPIDQAMMNETAQLIAKRRVSEEGQAGLKAFLNK